MRLGRFGEIAVSTIDKLTGLAKKGRTVVFHLVIVRRLPN